MMHIEINVSRRVKELTSTVAANLLLILIYYAESILGERSAAEALSRKSLQSG